jgi:hypothetical protein
LDRIAVVGARGLPGSGVHLQELISHQAVRLNRSDGIRRQDRPKVLQHAEGDAELSRRRRGHAYFQNFTGIHPRHTDRRSRLQPAQILEFGMKLDVVGKQLPAVADQKQRDGEQQEARDDKNSYRSFV